MSRLTDQDVIRRALNAHGFHFSRLRGQNFLVDPAVPEKMASMFDRGQAVLEIGPGFGALTDALCARAAEVTAVEVDGRLIPLLRENLKGRENLTLLEGDALRLDLAPLVPQGKPAAICANLPYSLTTPLLARFLETPRFDPIVVMVQREVAGRLCAAPGTPAYGAFTLFCALYAGAERLFDVPPGSFIPRPRVTSSVVRLTRHKEPPVPEAFRKTVTWLYKAAFSQRRKTLQNALTAGTGLPRDTVRAALHGAGIDPGARGETLSLQEYLEIAKHIKKEDRT